MFVRALIAFLALPGVAAFVVPAIWLWYAGHTRLAYPFGLLLLALGIGALVWCVAGFD